MTFRPIAACLTLTLLVACQKAADPVAAIRADQAKWQEDIKHRDARACAAHYAPDGVLYDAGLPPVSGQTALEAMMAGAFRDPNLKMLQTVEKIDVSADGTMGYVKGRYSETFTAPKTDAPMTESGYFVTIYRKQADGSWKVVQDVASPSPGIEGSIAGEGHP
jgi:uncharacterized protein (TIGR02246 family)